MSPMTASVSERAKCAVLTDVAKAIRADCEEALIAQHVRLKQKAAVHERAGHHEAAQEWERGANRHPQCPDELDRWADDGGREPTHTTEHAPTFPPPPPTTR